jgi:hypothetical protein
MRSTRATIEARHATDAFSRWEKGYRLAMLVLKERGERAVALSRKLRGELTRRSLIDSRSLQRAEHRLHDREKGRARRRRQVAVAND